VVKACSRKAETRLPLLAGVFSSAEEGGGHLLGACPSHRTTAHQHCSTHIPVCCTHLDAHVGYYEGCCTGQGSWLQRRKGRRL
jgi:hypothetical protein